MRFAAVLRHFRLLIIMYRPPYIHTVCVVVLLAAAACTRPSTRARLEAEQRRQDSIARVRDAEIQNLASQLKGKPAAPLSPDSARAVLAAAISRTDWILKGGNGGYAYKDALTQSGYIVMGADCNTPAKIQAYLAPVYSPDAVERFVLSLNADTVDGRFVISEPIAYTLPDLSRATFETKIEDSAKRLIHARITQNGQEKIYPISFYNPGGGRWLLDLSVGEIALQAEAEASGNAVANDADLQRLRNQLSGEAGAE